ncbi:MAG: recombinase family protein [Cyanobacteria bacterium P01_G01_bin.38]
MSAEHVDKQLVWQRLEAGRQAKAAKGGYVGYGSPAYGERAVNGQLVKDEKEQAIIDLIRRHHKSGKSLQQIADWMNQQGYKTKRGRQWQRISVKRVLDRLYSKSSKGPSLGQVSTKANPDTASSK